jgi:hypothetical protein
MQKCVSKALLDLSAEELDLSKEEVKVVNDIVDCLGPLKVSVECLCRRDTDIAKADTILEFIFKQLGEQGSDTADRLLENLCVHLAVRRNRDVSLLLYLKDYTNLQKQEIVPFMKMASKSTILKMAKNLLDRLYVDEDLEVDGEVEQGHPEPLEVHDGRVMKQSDLALELQAMIEKSESKVTAGDNHSVLQKEFQLHEATGKRTPNLEKLYKILCSIPPTSVESERAFNTVGQFVTKLRCSFKDNRIDALCMLRNDYLKQ